MGKKPHGVSKASRRGKWNTKRRKLRNDKRLSKRSPELSSTPSQGKSLTPDFTDSSCEFSPSQLEKASTLKGAARASYLAALKPQTPSPLTQRGPGAGKPSILTANQKRKLSKLKGVVKQQFLERLSVQPSVRISDSVLADTQGGSEVQDEPTVDLDRIKLQLDFAPNRKSREAPGRLLRVPTKQ